MTLDECRIVNVAIIGSGSFGTSLAKLIAENGCNALIWARNKEVTDSINKHHENKQYLPHFKLPKTVSSTNDLVKAFLQANIILFVLPTQVTREVLERSKHHIKQGIPIVVCSKGIEIGTNKLVCDIFLDVLGKDYKNQLFFLSGPSFAQEIAQQIPTAVTMAGYAKDKIIKIQSIFRSNYFKVYGTDDVIGVELSGALKNIIAIACGISDGLNMGNNSKAALITRGLAEIARLGKTMKANPITFMGLAGMGDLVLTCTGNLSRNRTVGIKIAEGMQFNTILKEMQQVAEGIPTTKSAYTISKNQKVSTPVIDGVYKILYEQKSPKQILVELMARDYKFETD